MSNNIDVNRKMFPKIGFFMINTTLIYLLLTLYDKISYKCALLLPEQRGF